MTTQVPNGVLAFDGGALSGFRNRIINGDMRVAQRGTGPLAPNVYTLDRWFVNSTGTAVAVYQIAGTYGPSSAAANIMQINGAASNTGLYIFQRIEAGNSRDLAGQTVTLSYWIYQSTGSTVTVTSNFQYANSADNFSTTTTIGTPAGTSVPTATWTKVIATQAIPGAATTGIQVALYNNATALGAGQTIYITNVQLELGTVATPFETRPIGTELALCQRYLPAYNGVNVNDAIGVGQATSTTTAQIQFKYPVTTRSAPTGLTFSGSINCTTSSGTVQALSSLSFGTGNLHASMIAITASSAVLVAGNAVQLIGGVGSQILFNGCEL